MKKYTFLLLLCLTMISNVIGQALEVESTTEGILIPRMTETQRDNINPDIEGMLIYQTNNTKGFYYFDGTSWAALAGGGGASSFTSKINGSDPSTLGLTYVGPSTAGPQGLKANQFVSGQGYYVDIYTSDSLAHETIYFTDNSSCTGTMYVEGGRAGRGYVFNGDAQLVYVPKGNSVVPTINYQSRLIFNPGVAPVCNSSSGSRTLMFQVLNNNSGTTGITLDPLTTYSVTFN